ncbi:helix-turn-helix domain-containing protein [candidate division WOR-3 bacterium]|nr:helix-turn-helix domain-containing protein [candidate division WOR-3 bacterium]
MGRKARPALHGLGALGARLKRVRQESGLSQMKLAKFMGFDPAHGYKYILRLEKGQVPNPTLRTIAAYIEACGARWHDIADVLPSTGKLSTPAARPLYTIPAWATGSMASGPRPAAPAAAAVPEPPARRRDSRPMREQLRSQRIEQRELHTRRFWSGVKRAEEATAALLHSSRVPSGLHRAYLSFGRSCCSAIDALATARPEVIQRQLAKLVQPAVAQGLDRKILAEIQSACSRVFRSQSNAE